MLVIVIVLLIDSKFYSTFAYVMYGIGCLLLLSVLLFGKEVNGAKSWFEIGTFRMQPVEFAKIAVCLAMARLMSSEEFSFKKKSIILLIMTKVFFSAKIMLKIDLILIV